MIELVTASKEIAASMAIGCRRLRRCCCCCCSLSAHTKLLWSLALRQLRWFPVQYALGLVLTVARLILTAVAALSLAKANDDLDVDEAWRSVRWGVAAFACGRVSGYLLAVARALASTQMRTWVVAVLLEQQVEHQLPPRVDAYVNQQTSAATWLLMSGLPTLVAILTELGVGLWFATAVDVPLPLVLIVVVPNAVTVLSGIGIARVHVKLQPVLQDAEAAFTQALRVLLFSRDFLRGQRGVQQSEERLVEAVADFWAKNLAFTRWTSLVLGNFEAVVSVAWNQAFSVTSVVLMARGEITLARVMIVSRFLLKITGSVDSLVQLYASYGSVVGKTKVLAQLLLFSVPREAAHLATPREVGTQLRRAHGVTLFGAPTLATLRKWLCCCCCSGRAKWDEHVSKWASEWDDDDAASSSSGAKPAPRLSGRPRMESEPQLLRSSVLGVEVRYIGKPLPFEGMPWAFTLAPGSRTLLRGPNGVGKSTLVRVLVGELLAPGQSLSIGGEAVQTDLRRDTTPLVAWLPQRATVVPSTLLDNVWMRSDKPCPEPRDIEDFIAKTNFPLDLSIFPQGWDTVLSLDGGDARISGGQLQRVALLRLVLAARDAKVVVLDEPETGLDDEALEWLFCWLWVPGHMRTPSGPPGAIKRLSGGPASPSRAPRPSGQKRVTVFHGSAREVNVNTAASGGERCQATVLIVTHHPDAYSFLRPGMLVISNKPGRPMVHSVFGEEAKAGDRP